MKHATCPPCYGNCRQARDCPAQGAQTAHLHRLWMGDSPTPVHLAVATQRDGTLRVLPTSAKPLMAQIDRSDAAEEGGEFREPAPARVPRRDRLTVNWLPLAGFLALIFGLPLCVWAWRAFW